jgi:hypothetical protein
MRKGCCLDYVKGLIDQISEGNRKFSLIRELITIHVKINTDTDIDVILKIVQEFKIEDKDYLYRMLFLSYYQKDSDAAKKIVDKISCQKTRDACLEGLQERYL